MHASLLGSAVLSNKPLILHESLHFRRCASPERRQTRSGQVTISLLHVSHFIHNQWQCVLRLFLNMSDLLGRESGKEVIEGRESDLCELSLLRLHRDARYLEECRNACVWNMIALNRRLDDVDLGDFGVGGGVGLNERQQFSCLVFGDLLHVD